MEEAGTRGCGLFGAFKEKLIGLAKQIKNIGKDDPRRIIHSLKVALAITLVSLLYYFRPLYDGFGAAGMWAVLTVVVVFEFSVGATLSKSINRGFATLLAGVLGVGAEYFAELFGKKGEPIVLGFLVFFLVAASTYTRFIPHIKKRYDYGVLIFILTFSLVSVSGYRVDKIIELAHQRLATIIIGAATCMIISIFVCPVWAGEDLHNLIIANIEKLGSFLEGFGDSEYISYCKDEDDNALISEDKSSFLQAYKTVLNSKVTEEALVNFAWWEPGHGSFRFRHPWKQYLKIGALSRQCACQFEALTGQIKPGSNKEPSELHRKIHEPCKKMSSEAGKALKELASALKAMAQPSASNIHVQNSKDAVDALKSVLENPSISAKADLMEIIPALALASILIEVVDCVQKISESVLELSDQASFKRSVTTKAPEKLLLHRGTIKPVSDVSDGDHVIITVKEERERAMTT